MSDKPSKPTNRSLFDWLGYRTNMDWNVATPLGRVFGSILAIAIPVLFFGSIVAAGFVLWGTIRDIGSGASSGPNLGAGAMIAALLGAPFIIWGTYLRQRAVEFQKEGLLTDRINKAVEMLGADKTWLQYSMDEGGNPVQVERTVPNIEVRIGGLLSLERIAQDSVRYDEGRDHVRVMEILCAYVRENAPASEAIDFPLPEWEPLKDDATEEEKAKHVAEREVRFGRFGRGKAQEWAQSLKGPREDIALALRIIGRREAAQRAIEATWGPNASEADIWVFDMPCPVLTEPVEGEIHGAEEFEAFRTALSRWSYELWRCSGYRLDLRNTNLQKADLSGLILSGCRLENARLEGANLSEARMEGADLTEARVEGADLTEARMEGANLWRARMEGANLSEARMGGIDLSEARMEGASLSQARVEIADLRNARMEGTNLVGTRLVGADLTETRMDETNLYWASMEAVNLTGARMEGVKSLFGATLNGTVVSSINLVNVPISQDQLNSTFGDASVTLPNKLTQPAHWPNWELPLIGDDGFYDQWQKWRKDPANYIPPSKPDEDPTE